MANLPIYAQEKNAEAKWSFLLKHYNIGDSFKGVDKQGRIAIGNKQQKLISVLAGSWPHFIGKSEIDLAMAGLAGVETLTNNFMEYMGKKSASMQPHDIQCFVADKVWSAKHESGAFASAEYQLATACCFALRLERNLNYECLGRQYHIIANEIFQRILEATQCDTETAKAIANGCVEAILPLLGKIAVEVTESHRSELVKAIDNIKPNTPLLNQG
jgi:hypothetical protein